MLVNFLRVPLDFVYCYYKDVPFSILEISNCFWK